MISLKPSVNVQTGGGGGTGVGVGVGVGVAAPPLQKTLTLSIRQPSLDVLSSLAMRQRKITVCPLADAGRFTIVLIKPPELPLHAIRPAIGLPKEVLMVAL